MTIKNKDKKTEEEKQFQPCAACSAPVGVSSLDEELQVYLTRQRLERKLLAAELIAETSIRDIFYMKFVFLKDNWMFKIFGEKYFKWAKLGPNSQD